MNKKNSTIKKVRTPLSGKDIRDISAGEQVLLSGVIFTARDQAHVRFVKLLKERVRLPVDLKGQVIYYAGPTPSGKRPIGSCGPTTSSRMDSFTGEMLGAGVRGMIGKGRRTESVRQAIKRSGAVYFLAPAGAGAYLSEKVVSCDLAAFDDLGPEAVYRLEVKDLPLIVGIDSRGNDVYSRLT
ncbi:MAG: FumA C-terminus/TtdB family hydratase beta subunit [Candidatus Omnitrophota bacterium]